VTAPCCTGINGSHEIECEANRTDRLVCYCCGATFSASWTCLWSDHGSRCFECDEHANGLPCLANVGETVEARRAARLEA
jgi:hypothetical protein